VYSYFRFANKKAPRFELSDEVALERGVEFLHEVVLYSLIFGIPLWEMNRSSNESREKEEKLVKRLGEVERKAEEAESKLEEIKRSRRLGLG
jgi:hypothetical protein